MAARQTAKKTTAAKSTQTKPTSPGDKIVTGDGEREPTPNERVSQSAVTNATVRPAVYADGEGFKAGQRAPKTKFLNRDRDKVSDKEFPDGGWVLVQKGDVVSPDVARQLDELS